MPHPLPDDAPATHGLRAAAVLRLLDRLEREGLDPHALVIVRNGTVLVRAAWLPWTPDRKSLVYSVSKTFTAIAIGLLESDGLIDVDAPVDRYLGGPNPHGLTVRHLLTMNTGHSREQALALPFSASAVLETPPAHAPGHHFAYNSPASYTLAAIATAVSGRSLTSLLSGRLFEPLGIGRRWWVPLNGIDEGFSGLHLSVDDLAVVGVTLADGGAFHGRQVVPAEFIEAATTPWSDTRQTTEDGGDWSLGYGYQLWRSRHGFRLDGAYGQFALVVPESGIVIAYQGATTRTQATLDGLWELVESFEDAPVADAPADTAELANRLASLDSWDARARFTVDDASMPAAADWDLIHAGPGRWELATPRGRFEVTDGAWNQTVLGGGAQALVLAARAEERADGSVLLHVVVPTSPHRLIITRDRNALHLGWHTVPLWSPSIDTLLVPDWLAHAD